MNEDEWLASADPIAMLDYLEGKVSDRKLRLFACACVRRHWGLLRYRTPREAVELAERLAEGQADAQAVEDMRQTAEMSGGTAPMFEQLAYMAAAATLAEQAAEAARTACEFCRQQAVRDEVYELVSAPDEVGVNAVASATEYRAQAELLREIVGTPFRPVTIDPNWLSIAGGVAGTLATLIDEQQSFEELPFLADALMDAGCGDEALLAHLREPGVHRRGCWALDALLGKE
jgi:hypothetical protein